MSNKKQYTSEEQGFTGVLKEVNADYFNAKIVVTTEEYHPPAALGYINREIEIAGYGKLYLHIINN